MDDLECWLRLTQTKGIGTVSAKQLLSYFSTPQSILDASEAQLLKSGISEKQARAFRACDVSTLLSTTQDWLKETNHHLLTINSSDYPKKLIDIHDAPILLYVIGDKEVLNTPQLAIVGSRKPSSSAQRTAREFARSLSQTGITITSGLALGIDAAAHQGTLDTQGLTIAVAATGLDRIYPAIHRDLAYKIIENGAIVSEFALGTATSAHAFPKRNRIISGLSIGTLVVEAAIRSGSLTTARHAMEQNREILAIPGSIHNPLARGCHQLIRQGAKLVETADDVLEELASHLSQYLQDSLVEEAKSTSNNTQAKPDNIDPSYNKLMQCLDFSPQSIDQLVSCSGLAANEVASMLLILQLQDDVDVEAGNRYLLRS